MWRVDGLARCLKHLEQCLTEQCRQYRYHSEQWWVEGWCMGRCLGHLERRHSGRRLRQLERCYLVRWRGRMGRYLRHLVWWFQQKRMGLRRMEQRMA